MSNCNECIEVDPIPTCATSWQINGAVDPVHDGATLVYRITNIATGRVETGLTEPVDVDGTVTITVPIDELMDHPYKLELLQEDLELVEITVGELESCCIEFTTFPFTTDTVIFSNAGCNV